MRWGFNMCCFGRMVRLKFKWSRCKRKWGGVIGGSLFVGVVVIRYRVFRGLNSRNYFFRVLRFGILRVRCL